MKLFALDPVVPRAWLLLSLAALAVSACGTHQSVGQSSDGGTPDAANGGSGGGGGGSGGSCSGCTNTPVATDFVLDNQGSVPVVTGSQCGGSWLGVQRDGKDLAIERSCLCSCDAMNGACGCPAICLFTGRLLLPGQTEAKTWDGIYADAQPKGCYDAAAPEHGSALTAQACWNVEDTTQAGSCTTQAFAYAKNTRVHITAKPVTVPKTTTPVTLENRTGGPIELVTDHCGSQGWFEVSAPGQKISVVTFCPCSCTDKFELGICPSCGGCADDVVETLQPGASKLLQWDGKFWSAYPSGCEAGYDMPAHARLAGKVCWRTPGSQTPHCQTAQFAHGDTVQITAM